MGSLFMAQPFYMRKEKLLQKTWFDRFESEITLLTQGTTTTSRRMYSNGRIECKSVVMGEIQCKYNPEIQTFLHIYPVTCLGFSCWFSNGTFLYTGRSLTQCQIAHECLRSHTVQMWRQVWATTVYYGNGFCCGDLSEIYSEATLVRTLRLFSLTAARKLTAAGSRDLD